MNKKLSKETIGDNRPHILDARYNGPADCKIISVTLREIFALTGSDAFNDYGPYGCINNYRVRITDQHNNESGSHFVLDVAKGCIDMHCCLELVVYYCDYRSDLCDGMPKTSEHYGWFMRAISSCKLALWRARRPWRNYDDMKGAGVVEDPGEFRVLVWLPDHVKGDCIEFATNVAKIYLAAMHDNLDNYEVLACGTKIIGHC